MPELPILGISSHLLGTYCTNIGPKSGLKTRPKIGPSPLNCHPGLAKRLTLRFTQPRPRLVELTLKRAFLCGILSKNTGIRALSFDRPFLFSSLSLYFIITVKRTFTINMTLGRKQRNELQFRVRLREMAVRKGMSKTWQLLLNRSLELQ